MIAPQRDVARAPLRELSAPLTAARVFVIDDEEPNRRLLVRILQHAGYDQITTISDPSETVPLFLSQRPDILLLDLNMPGLDGEGVLHQLRPHVPESEYLPILILTGDVSAEAKQRTLSAGAKDFLAKPFESGEVLLRIRNLLETRRLHLALRGHNETLETAVLERTRALRETQVEVLERLAAAAEFRDDVTGQHTQRVGEMAARLAMTMRFPSARVELIRRAAPLHDVGKIGIPDRILLKPGPLTPDEFTIMKTHTTIGAQILANGRSELLVVAERIALGHHERWDGTGYPSGLAGEAIPVEARLTSVADFFDALRHDRPYRAAWPVDRVITELRDGAGKQFDPRVVEAFVQGLAQEGDDQSRAARCSGTP